jgi:hypothetical protein
MNALTNMRVQVIKFKAVDIDDLLPAKLRIKDIKKHIPENIHRFRASFKFFINSLLIYFTEH